jgi:alpha-1,6-mannosyltransferase
MRLREGRAWMTNAVLCLLGVGLTLLARQFVVENSRFWLGFNGVSELSALLYLAAIVVVLTQPLNRATVWIVLGFAVAMRAMTIFAESFSSSDIYRYVWDGIVQHAHVNPYRYVPGDAALTFLRGPHQEVFDNINRRDYARTIYPPVAQIIYYCVTFFSPTVQAMKVAMFGFECVTVGALLALLRRMGRCREEILLYAWCPLLVWEIGGGGHIDAAVMAFVALALLFRHRGQTVWVGVFLACAVLTKFYPLVLLPALYQRRDWKMPAVLVAMSAATYAMYSSVGRLVFGFAGGYAKEEGIETGTRYFLLELAQSVRGLSGLPVWVYVVFCAGVMGALVWWAWKKATVEVCIGPESPEFIRIALALALALMLLFSPHYPWYIVWLIPFLVLVPNLPLLVYLMAFFYLFTTPLADGTIPNMFLVNKILYGAVGLAWLLQVILRRWPMGRWFVSAERKVDVPYPGIRNS